MHTGNIHLTTEHILALRNYPRKQAYLMAALEDISAHFGCIPEASKRVVCDYFNMGSWPNDLIADLFHSSSDNVNNIRVCEGPCCRKAGSDQLAETLNAELHTAVERHHCMGNCHHAPVAMVNGEIVVKASPAGIMNLLP